MSQRDLFENVARNEPGWLEFKPAPAKATTPAIEARQLPPLDWQRIEGECVHFATQWPNLTTHPDGYGIGQINGKLTYAHRHAWLEAGRQIPDREQVRHKCGNPWCVNPDHLTTGTPWQNRQDALAHGTRRGGLVLPDERVRVIHRHAIFRVPAKITAALLGVTIEATDRWRRKLGSPERKKRRRSATRQHQTARKWFGAVNITGALFP